ncbi:hypothetical protein [Streptomyces sp. NPDC005989]|uniref:hypothetical protein n=1 Tax=unclassified Streptomyces TaxID=2593676 RepID=UPI0034076908
MSVRRFVPIAAAVLVASLAACSPSAGGSESDSKPSADALKVVAALQADPAALRGTVLAQTALEGS